ncbi:MAG: glycosyltransferase family 9 protein, partial [Desulfonatronovibrio sp.]
MDKPVLVLQMQRMGDLILSFPLFLWLRNMYPERKIRVVAEKSFYEGLVSLSPEVLYIPWEMYEHALKEKYSLVVNLSHRSKAAWLTGKVKADNIIGPYLDGKGVLRISGDWQLYRSSIVHNNRYNRFHWAELNALDVVGQKLIKRTRWNPVKIDPGNKRIGVFIGASDEIKRPAPDFFALLCREL